MKQSKVMGSWDLILDGVNELKKRHRFKNDSNYLVFLTLNDSNKWWRSKKEYCIYNIYLVRRFSRSWHMTFKLWSGASRPSAPIVATEENKQKNLTSQKYEKHYRKIERFLIYKLSYTLYTVCSFSQSQIIKLLN